MSAQKQEEHPSVDFYGFYHLLNQYVVEKQRDDLISMAVKQNSMKEVGFRIGRSIIEIISENTIDRFKEDNQIKGTPAIRFLCKDFWNLLFLRNVDQVTGNTSGQFFLILNYFIMFQRISNFDSPEVQQYINLWHFVVQGLVLGALKGLSYEADVKVEPHNDPTAKPPTPIGAFKVSIKMPTGATYQQSSKTPN